eukprot:457481_1
MSNETPKTYNNDMHSPKTSKANGIVDDIQYFKCNEGNAIFRRSEDLYTILTGNKSITKHVTIQKNSKPSLNNKHHSNTKPNNNKHSYPKIKKSESVPYKNNTDSNGNLPPLMDLSHEMNDNISISDIEIEIEEYNNDHSNETKEEEEDYDYPLKLQSINASDEMYDDNTITNRNNKPARKNTGIMIAESDTSDIDDHLIIITSTKSPPLIPLTNTQIPHITIDDDDNINPISTYLDHVHMQNVSPSPKSYDAPTKSRKSIKKLKSQFKNACSGNNNKKLFSTPVKFGQLSLEYSTSSPTEDIDNENDDDFIRKSPKPSKIRVSKSVPPNININDTDDDDEEKHQSLMRSSQSARNSPTGDRDRALTFPTMALNTDNAIKVSSATPSQQTFKVVILGQSRVGKTSIIRRFVKDKFISSYKMTINANQWQFKCEVPIDLYEHIEHDKNMLKSMTNLFAQSMDMINEETHNIDPFDEDDKNAEFGDQINYDYNTMPNEQYQLNNMDH